MTQARDYISKADDVVRNRADSSHAVVYALLSIACTLADMADMDADTRTQPAIRPPQPAPHYELYMPGDPDRIPT